MKTIGLIVNRRKKGASALAIKLRAWLRKRNKTVLMDSSGMPALLQKSDMIICFGGDGTILNLAGKLKRSTPILGVNLGGLGFLTHVMSQEVYGELEGIFNDTCVIEERVLMEVKWISGKKSRRFQALNDAVINREGLSRYLRLEVKAGKEDLMRFSGDGVIVATPTGSTAYSLSAGGPFVYPTLKNLVVTPLSAHSLFTRPIVLPADKKICLRFKSNQVGGKASLVIDGQKRQLIQPRDEVQISLAEIRLHLIGSSERSYLKTLREKFGLVESKN